MATRMSVGTRVLAVLLIGALASSAALAKKPEKPEEPPSETPDPPVTYDIVWLNDLGDNAVIPLGVSQSRTVVGYMLDGSGNRLAFVCPYPAPEAIADLTERAVLMGGLSSEATLTCAACINNDGQIAGNMVHPDGEAGVFVCSVNGSGLQTLSPSQLGFASLDSMRAADQNEDGVVLGRYAIPENGGCGCFVWEPGKTPIIIHGLSDPEGHYETPATFYAPSSLNNHLWIVGKLPSQSGLSVIRWQLTDLGALDQTADPEMLPGNTQPWVGKSAINEDDVIASNVKVSGRYRPARYTETNGWEVLYTNNRPAGYSAALNAEGHICGQFEGKTSNDRGPGFVFFGEIVDSVFGFWSLDELVNPDPDNDDFWFFGDWTYDCIPVDMSDIDETGYGTIVGRKECRGQVRGFVLIPVSP